MIHFDFTVDEDYAKQIAELIQICMDRKKLRESTSVKVHFDFVVDDEEAEELLKIIDENIAETQEEIAKLKTNEDLSEIENRKKVAWSQMHVEDLKSIKGKMKNSWIDNCFRSEYIKEWDDA